METKITRKRRFELAPAERFELWGQRVTHITVRPGERFVTLRGRNGFIGTVLPGQSADVQNALYVRGIDV